MKGSLKIIISILWKLLLIFFKENHISLIFFIWWNLLVNDLVSSAFSRYENSVADKYRKACLSRTRHNVVFRACLDFNYFYLATNFSRSPSLYELHFFFMAIKVNNTSRTSKLSVRNHLLKIRNCALYS